jgi:hypothetical protein
VPQDRDDRRPLTPEEARRQLQGSWDYAFAMGHGCSIGPDPGFHALRRKVADLSAITAGHTLGKTVGA